MSRTTGLTACAISHLLIDGKIEQNGVICPEIIGQNDENFEFVKEYLKERDIEIKITRTSSNTLQLQLRQLTLQY